MIIRDCAPCWASAVLSGWREAYLARHPSDSFTLRNLGRRLVEFLEIEPQWIAPNANWRWTWRDWNGRKSRPSTTRPSPQLTIDSLAGNQPGADSIAIAAAPHPAANWPPVDEFLIQIKHAERLRNEASNAMEMHPARLRHAAQAAVEAQNRFSGRPSRITTPSITNASNRRRFPCSRPSEEGDHRRGVPSTGRRGRRAARSRRPSQIVVCTPGPPSAGCAVWIRRR